MNLSQVVAPPYDVITPEDQRRYLKQDPFNVVRLIVPEVRATDHPGDNKYTRAAACFQQWLASGILRREPEPCVYIYRQTFTPPAGGPPRSRVGILGVVKLEPFGEGVLAHERTNARPKADRLSLTQAVVANLSPVFALYRDPQGQVRALLDAATAAPPALQLETGGGEAHAVWRIDSLATVRALAEALSPSQLFIADGHHRYETALNYRNKQRAAHPDASPSAAFNYVLMLLVDAADPSLLILPTHRLLRDVEGAAVDRLLQHLRPEHGVTPVAGPADLIAELGQSGPGHRVGLALPGHRYALVDLKAAPSADPVSRLDVTVLHREVFENLLGLREGLMESERHLTYTRDPDFALRQVEAGAAQAAFLLRPPGVQDMLDVALAGEVMPQKSTYFYPKPASGIVFNPLDPAIEIADL